MNSNYEHFFKNNQEIDYLKEKTLLMREGKGKNSEIFYGDFSCDNLKNKMKDPTIIPNFIRQSEGKTRKTTLTFSFFLFLLFNIFFHYVHPFNNSIPFSTYCIFWYAFFSSYLTIGIIFSFIIFEGSIIPFKIWHRDESDFLKTCLNKYKIKHIFNQYLYSPDIIADKNYIEKLLKENKNKTNELFLFDDLMRKKGEITYLEINNIFGLTNYEKEQNTNLAYEIINNEVEKINEYKLSGITTSLLK